LSYLTCDVFIVGGGPSGLATAIALRQRGLDVAIADSLVPPIDKACGEGIMPDSRHELSQLGITLQPEHGSEFAGIRFVDEQSAVSAEFTSGAGFGIRRLTLHRLLLDRARALGVRMLWDAHVSLVDGQPPQIDGQRIGYRYLVGADGQSSRMRRWAGLHHKTQLLSKRFGFRAHFRMAPWSTHVEVHWGPLGQAYVTPVSDQEICISVMTRHHENVRFADVVNGIPFLREKIAGAETTTRERGAVTTTCKLKHVVSGNVALVGDASGSADAITGEGLGMGFRQAHLLANAIEQDDLTLYASGHGSILRLPQMMARAMLLMDRWPLLRARVLRVLASRPSLFGEMLRVHLGEEPMPTFIRQHGAELGRLLFLPSLT
jgi:flavin-dependent dehydrogenase